ncbi:hypothetical protein CULT_2330007 [[Clostridium] ultunense Esp]|nr:hypothetical protein CULT_2330007 [[Clostridium] ultunense Esp]
MKTGGYTGWVLRPCPKELDEARNALPPSDRNKNVAAKMGLRYCNQLYAALRDLKEASPEERYEERLKRSKPILEAFSAWLHQMSDHILPKSTFGQAVQYCLNQWENLTNDLKDGRLEIDKTLVSALLSHLSLEGRTGSLATRQGERRLVQLSTAS